MGTQWIGSPEHKELFCRFFIDTHLPYEPDRLPWPDLDAASRGRLAALPIWEEAVRTEAQTAAAVTAMGRVERDPLLSQAIALQGYEEARHAELLAGLTRRYAIPVPPHQPQDPADPAWAFLRIGYGECFDSFFAFGLFALARQSGFFPPPLVDLFEPVMQEEARHIIFHVNWVAYCQARLPAARRPSHVFRRALAVWLQLATRLRTAARVRSETARDQDNFTMSAHQSFGDISARTFLETCLRENERRLAPYDARLLRPSFVPAVARTILRGVA
jgi:hypothetical protein